MLFQSWSDASTIAIVDFGSYKGTYGGNEIIPSTPAGEVKVVSITDKNLLDKEGQSTGWKLSMSGFRWDASLADKAYADTAWNNGDDLMGAMGSLSTSLGVSESDLYQCWGDNILVVEDKSTAKTLTLSGMAPGTYIISLGVGRSNQQMDSTLAQPILSLQGGTVTSGQYAVNKGNGDWADFSGSSVTIKDATNAALVQWEVKITDASESLTITLDTTAANGSNKHYTVLDFMSIQAVPEPSGAAMFLGSLLLVPFRRRR